MKKIILASFIFLVVLAIFTPIPALTDLDVTEAVTNEPPVEPTGQQFGQDMTLFDASGGASPPLGAEFPVSSGAELTPFVPLPHLVLSEVFFDGSDERFEIANIGSGDFIGPLTVQGAKAAEVSLGTVHISAGTALIWGDTMSQIIDRSFIQGSSLGLSISDSAALQMLLYSSGELIDALTVDTSVVSSLPNHYGFEKVRSGDSLVTLSTNTGRIMNVSGSWVANPGFVSTLSATSTPVVPAPLEISTGAVVSTGDTFSGESNSGTSLYTGFLSDLISFSEIHPGSDAFPEYIEIHFSGMFQGPLTVKGLGASSTSKTFTVFAITGQYLVISDLVSGFSDPSAIVLLDSISLTDGGESLVIYDSSGYIHDAILYTGSESLHSRYRSSGEAFSIELPVTPAFSERALTFLSFGGAASPQNTSVPKDEGYYESLYKKRKERYYSLKAQLTAFGISINVAGMAYKKNPYSSEVELLHGSEEFSLATTGHTESFLRIAALLPDAPGKDEGEEQLILTLLSGVQTDLSEFFINAGSKKTLLTGFLLLSGESQTFKGNFGLTNKPMCITLEKREVVYDTFCYGQPKAGIRATTTGDITNNLSMSGISDYSRMKELSFSLLTGQACALFGEVSFHCISLKGIDNELLKGKYDKKLASLHAKYDKKQYQYTGLQERYKTMKTSLDAKRRKYYQQVKSVRSSYKEQLAEAKLESRIRKNYGQLLQAGLKKNRYMVRKDSHIAFIQTLLDANMAALQSEGTGGLVHLEGGSFLLGELKKQYLFATDPGVVIDTLIGKGLTITLPKAAALRQRRLSVWYDEEE